MRSVEDVRRSVVDLIKHIYVHPFMYGPLAIELDATLVALHWVLAEIDQTGEKLAKARVEVGGPALHEAGTFARAFSIAFPKDVTEDEKITYVSSQWHEVSRHMGICE